ncbi:MAG: hypothetical protein KME21_31830 [Desmonostoc vinosum HA7617-LM4]|jgi:hypothetical protein|nr:hypothetical protein [Desmonostoc vinosum HA7617-LM4]
MTQPIYTYQQLHLKSIARLKQIYSEIGCTAEVSDKRCKDAWISAIASYQSAQIQKVAQTELDQFIATQAQAVAPEQLRTVEISFYDHEYYIGNQLVAAITHDHDLTQPWVVMVNNTEVFRAATPMMCDRYIRIHYKDGTLPVQEQEPTPCTSENRIMAHIFNECQNYGFEILNDGIYKDGVKLGQVGCTDGNWWVIQGGSGQQQYSDSVFDAVRSLSMVDTPPATESTPEYLQYRPLEQLTTEELQQLLDVEAADCEQLLDLPFEQLTAQDWQRLQQYEPVAA